MREKILSLKTQAARTTIGLLLKWPGPLQAKIMEFIQKKPKNFCEGTKKSKQITILNDFSKSVFVYDSSNNETRF